MGGTGETPIASDLGPRPCPACGASSSQWAFFAHGHPYVQCNACQSFYVAPLPVKASRAADDLDRELLGRAAQRHAEQLAGHGCRHALLVGDREGALRIELEGYGIGAIAIEAAELTRFEPGRLFDAVAMYGVLGDLADPLAALERGRGLLPQGGLLAVSTASASGVPARVLGQRFPMVKFPDRLALYSQDGLTCLLTRAGLSPIRWSSASDDRPVAFTNGVLGRALASVGERSLAWLDRVGFGRNFEVLAERVL